MIIKSTQLTPALKHFLERAHDADYIGLLEVRQHDGDIIVNRTLGQRACAGYALTATEELEVKALLAAHAVEPLK